MCPLGELTIEKQYPLETTGRTTPTQVCRRIFQ